MAQYSLSSSDPDRSDPDRDRRRHRREQSADPDADRRKHSEQASDPDSDRRRRAEKSTDRERRRRAEQSTDRDTDHRRQRSTHGGGSRSQSRARKSTDQPRRRDSKRERSPRKREAAAAVAAGDAVAGNGGRSRANSTRDGREARESRQASEPRDRDSREARRQRSESPRKSTDHRSSRMPAVAGGAGYDGVNDRVSGGRSRANSTRDGREREGQQRSGSPRKSTDHRSSRMPAAAAGEYISPRRQRSESPRKSVDHRSSRYAAAPEQEPLRSTVRAVTGEYRPPFQDTPRSVPRAMPEPQVPAMAHVDGGGDTPDSRLMGGGKEKKRHKTSSMVGAAASVAAAASRRARGKSAKAKRPDSTDSYDSVGPQKKRRCGKWFWIILGLTILLLVIFIPVGVVVSKKNSEAQDSGSKRYGEVSTLPPQSAIPAQYKNTYMDPYTWQDTTDFNLTFTDKMVGGLPIMGLFDKYDDSVQANPNVPALNEPWDYGKMPVRGVNVGGWLIIEPFITPSFFDAYSSRDGVVDEYTLSAKLGAKGAKDTVEKHYKTFVTRDTFKEIRDAGLDHVRIPFGYWAVKTYDDDTFVPNVSWRYLLRAIEWAREFGLRVKLDLHSVPGGANGWNHSGRLGPIGWLMGPKGDENGKRTLEIHAQLSEFFAQPRYKNIVTMYGLVNEPKMIELDPNRVIKWSEDAHTVIRSKGYKGKIIFGDGFRGLSTWKGEFAGYDGMLLDVHQYVIFNTGLIALTHSRKIEFACKDWSNQIQASMDTTSGFGPTIVGEWGQADTDCTPYLNNVGVGSRWEGTMDPNSQTMGCPSGKNCSCKMPNGDPKDYTPEYRQFLKMFAEAQMHAFEKGWGWLYWTWDTEASTQWSYKKSLAAGIIPQKAYERTFNCELDAIPDFGAAGLPEGN